MTVSADWEYKGAYSAHPHLDLTTTPGRISPLCITQKN
jgi:hypothetical protein